MRLLGILLSVFLFSCSDQREIIAEPKNLIPEDTMVLVLRDLTLIESHIQMKYEGVSVFKELMERSGDHVLSTHKVTSERFESSLDYYGSRQDKMQELYSRVLDSLNVMSGKIGIEKNVPASDEIEKPDFLKIDK